MLAPFDIVTQKILTKIHYNDVYPSWKYNLWSTEHILKLSFLNRTVSKIFRQLQIEPFQDLFIALHIDGCSKKYYIFQKFLP